MSFLQVIGLSAGYGKSMVLRGIGLAVGEGEGEGEAVVGKNGAGKSTLLNSFFEAITLQAGRQSGCGRRSRSDAGLVRTASMK